MRLRAEQDAARIAVRRRSVERAPGTARSNCIPGPDRLAQAQATGCVNDRKARQKMEDAGSLSRIVDLDPTYLGCNRCLAFRFIDLLKEEHRLCGGVFNSVLKIGSYCSDFGSDV